MQLLTYNLEKVYYVPDNFSFVCGSKRAEAIIPHVEEMALRYTAKVILLKVEEPAILLEWDEVIDLQRYKEEYNRQRKQTESYLETIRENLSGKGIET